MNNISNNNLFKINLYLLKNDIYNLLKCQDTKNMIMSLNFFL